MSHITIWIDHGHCFLYEFSADAIKEKKIEGATHPDHEHLKKFYHEVATKIGSPDQLLIVGPGVAKDEFRHHCESHHPGLAKKIAGTEVMKSHPSEAEILKVSKKFFDHYFLWHNK